MKVIFLTAALAAIPSVSDARSEHYLLSQLNNSAVGEVIQTTESEGRSKPVRTFLSNKIKNLKWHPVGNTVRRLKDKE